MNITRQLARATGLAAALVISAGTAVASEPAASAWTDEQAAAALYAAARTHADDFSRLLQSRGMPRLQDRPALQAILRDGVHGLTQSAVTANRRDTVLVFYHHDGVFLHIWAATAGRVAWARVPLSGDELAQRVAAMHAQLRVPGSARGVTREDADEPAHTQADASALAGAADWLFPAPVAALLDAPGIDRLQVVPWGAIAGVPFGVLPRGARVLADTHAVTVAPSLNDLYAEPVHRAPSPTRPFVIGNPAFAAHSGLARLPGAAREAGAVAALFGTRPHLDNEATLAAVTAQLADADLLYFATHGIVDAADPLDGSYLALAGDDRWPARAIQHARLRRGAIVVMSACDTGRGEVQRAGVVGLARAFQLAGAAEVVMSLWPVDDDATAQLMPRFTALLREGLPADRALQQAMREQRVRTPDPARWGAFTVFSRPVMSP